MGYGLAALAGLGQGTGGLLQGMLAGDQLAMEQAKLQQQGQYQQGHLDLLRQQLMMPMLLEQQKAARAQDTVRQLQEAMKPGPPTMTPGSSLEMAPPGALLKPPAAGPAAPLSQPESPVARLQRMIPILATVAPTEAIKAQMDLAVPPKPQILEKRPWGQMTPTGPVEFPKPAAPAFTPPPGTRESVKMGPEGDITREWGYGPEHEITANEVEQAVAAAKANPGDAVAQQHAQIAVAAWKRRESLQASGATKLDIKLPDPSQIQRGATLGDAVKDLRRLAATAAARPRAGVLGHQIEQRGTAFENLTGIPLLSEEEAAYQTDFTTAKANFMNALNASGIGRNAEMMRQIQEAFSDPTAPNAAARLNALANTMERHLQTFQTSVEGGGRSAPTPGPLPPGGPAPSTTKPPARQFLDQLFNPQAPLVENPARLNAPTGRNTVSRQSPAYQRARAAGLTDAQIQQKYGVQVVP